MAEAPEVSEVPQEAAAPETVPENGSAPPAEQPKPARTIEEIEAELAKTRREAASYRTKLREVEPIAKKALEAEEADKTEVQKANERAQVAEREKAEILENYARMELGVQYHLEPKHINLIGSGTREEMEENAKELAALSAAAAKATPPPTQQPVEGLRPGASPEPAKEPDDSYPAAWAPSWMRGDNDSRSSHGQ